MQVLDISEKLSRLRFWRQSADRESPLNKPADEQPLRAELFNVDQLERHAKAIAAAHQLSAGRAPDKLLPRLDENQRVLMETYDLMRAAADQNRHIEPAAEWLFDNFYLIEEQIRAIRRLYEEHPSRYAADIARRHRWMRGDWQIAAWLLPWVRGREGPRVRNPISALSRWKIFDNLRRSVVPIAMLLVLLVSWFILPAIAGAALLFLASVVLLPTLFGGASDLLHKPVDLPLGMHLRVTLQALGRPLAHNALTFVFLPYEAYISADAIVRTLIRMG